MTWAVAAAVSTCGHHCMFQVQLTDVLPDRCVCHYISHSNLMHAVKHPLHGCKALQNIGKGRIMLLFYVE